MKTQILNFNNSIKTGSYQFVNSIDEFNSIKDGYTVSGSRINNIYCENVIFNDCNFQSCDISDSKFVNCLFLNCNFSFCKLDNCNLISCTIEDTLFYLTNSLNCNLLSCTFKNIERVHSYNQNEYIFNCKDKSQSIEVPKFEFAIAA